MQKRELADRRRVEGGQTAPAAAPDGETAYPVPTDMGERRLGWFVAAMAIATVVVLAATLSKLPGLGESAEPSALQGAPAATGPQGGMPSAGTTADDRAGDTPTGAVATSPAASRPGEPAPAAPRAPATAPATGGAGAPPVAGTTAARGGTAGPATRAPVATGGPGSTAEPIPTAGLPPEVKAALTDLRVELFQQVGAGQFDQYAADDLRGKVHQVAREVSEGDWPAARYYSGRIRDKLRKYRDDGRLTSTGYQALIRRLDVLDRALS